MILADLRDAMPFKMTCRFYSAVNRTDVPCGHAIQREFPMEIYTFIDDFPIKRRDFPITVCWATNDTLTLRLLNQIRLIYWFNPDLARVQDYLGATSGDITRQFRNADPDLHPFERAREYQRALKVAWLGTKLRHAS